MNASDHTRWLEEPYRRFVEPMGALAIAFAQADAALFWLLIGCSDEGEHAVLLELAKDSTQPSVLNIINRANLAESQLAEVISNVDLFFKAKYERNRYMHAEWYIVFDDDPEIAVGLRKIPRKIPKKPQDLVIEHSDADLDRLWGLVQQFAFCTEGFEAIRYDLAKTAANEATPI